MKVKRYDKRRPAKEKRENPLYAGWKAKGITGPKNGRKRAKFQG